MGFNGLLLGRVSDASCEAEMIHPRVVARQGIPQLENLLSYGGWLNLQPRPRLMLIQEVGAPTTTGFTFGILAPTLARLTVGTVPCHIMVFLKTGSAEGPMLTQAGDLPFFCVFLYG